MAFDAIFQPLVFKNLTVKNRICCSAHADALAEDGMPTDRTVRYYELKARGGPRQFFILVNDYTEAKVNPAGEPVASCQPEAAHRKIWHYSPPNGIIKWVNEVNKDGSCTLRSSEDLAAFATAELKRLGD